MPQSRPSISVAVPLYSRPEELRELLASMAALEVPPDELLLCEDHSPERPLLRQIALEFRETLRGTGCALRYVENETNLGYDGNVRRLLEISSGDWVMLLGNDDVLLPCAISRLRQYLAENRGVHVVSRSFLRFDSDVSSPLGLSRQSVSDRLFTRRDSDAGVIMRLCGFVGGLAIERQWAVQHATSRYDGTLYYQLYLGALAYADGGIGYISAPIVGARVDRAPLFGSAKSEKALHTPGAYTAKGRAAMWSGALRICADIQQRTSVPLLSGMRRELARRQSFHVFEMTARRGRRATIAMARELHRVRTMSHPLPWALFVLVMLLGRNSTVVFRILRERLQPVGGMGQSSRRDDLQSGKWEKQSPS